MKLIAMAVALLGLLAACDTGSSGNFSIDTAAGNIEVEFTPPPTTEFRSDMGTQVGSEGFWGCPILTAEPISDRMASIEALGGVPLVLAAARMGPWPLEILDTWALAPIPGTLMVADGGEYLWIDVEEGEGCYDHLLVSVLGTLNRESSELEAVSGWLAIRSDASRLIVTSQAPFATTTAAWGMPDLVGANSLRIDAALGAQTLDGAALYVDCDQTVVECPSAEESALVHSVR